MWGSISYGRSLTAVLVSSVFGVLTYTGVIPNVASPDALRMAPPGIPGGVPASVERLQAYLRVRTDHPSPDYKGAMSFLNETALSLLPDAELSQVELVAGKPILFVRIPGRDRSLPALLLNSHTDVVPAEKDKWRWDPFGAALEYVSSEWRVYARGSQDMKCVGMQYLEALGEMVGKGDWKPERDIIVSFVPDEEIGGFDGMGKLVDGGKGEVWKKLNVGAALDEGLANPKQGYNVYYGERQTWWLVVEAIEKPGHGALSPEVTASQRIATVVGKALAFRAEQRSKVDAEALENNNVTNLIGVNLVFTESGIPSDKSPSGYIMNMIPSKARCGFDIRVPPHVDHSLVDAEIESWMACEDGKRCPGLSSRFVQRIEVPEVTSTEHPMSKAFMRGLTKARSSMPGPASHAGVFFAATDIRFLRHAGVPAIGFSPMELMPALLHKHDEYITVDGYLSGVQAYKHIIREMAGWWESGDEKDTSAAVDVADEEPVHAEL